MNRIEELLNLLQATDDTGDYEHIAIAKGKYELIGSWKDIIKASKRHTQKLKDKKNG